VPRDGKAVATAAANYTSADSDATFAPPSSASFIAVRVELSFVYNTDVTRCIFQKQLNQLLGDLDNLRTRLQSQTAPHENPPPPPTPPPPQVVNSSHSAASNAAPATLAATGSHPTAWIARPATAPASAVVADARASNSERWFPIPTRFDEEATEAFDQGDWFLPASMPSAEPTATSVAVDGQEPGADYSSDFEAASQVDVSAHPALMESQGDRFLQQFTTPAKVKVQLAHNHSDDDDDDASSTDGSVSECIVDELSSASDDDSDQDQDQHTTLSQPAAANSLATALAEGFMSPSRLHGAMREALAKPTMADPGFLLCFLNKKPVCWCVTDDNERQQ
jgi:hypothetical protein